MWPRLTPFSDAKQDIMSVPQVSGVCPPNDLETFESQQVASDCLWSDPAKGDQVRAVFSRKRHLLRSAFDRSSTLGDRWSSAGRNIFFQACFVCIASFFPL